MLQYRHQSSQFNIAHFSAGSFLIALFSTGQSMQCMVAPVLLGILRTSSANLSRCDWLISSYFGLSMLLRLPDPGAIISLLSLDRKHFGASPKPKKRSVIDNV
jgi:hypothetical protein